MEETTSFVVVNDRATFALKNRCAEKSIESY